MILLAYRHGLRVSERKLKRLAGESA